MSAGCLGCEADAHPLARLGTPVLRKTKTRLRRDGPKQQRPPLRGTRLESSEFGLPQPHYPLIFDERFWNPKTLFDCPVAPLRLQRARLPITSCRHDCSVCRLAAATRTPTRRVCAPCQWICSRCDERHVEPSPSCPTRIHLAQHGVSGEYAQHWPSCMRQVDRWLAPTSRLVSGVPRPPVRQAFFVSGGDLAGTPSSYLCLHPRTRCVPVRRIDESC